MWERISRIETKCGEESLYRAVHTELRDKELLELLMDSGAGLTAKTMKGNVATDKALR